MPDFQYFPGLPVNIPGLPDRLLDIVQKLYSYGFTLSRDAYGVWTLRFPHDSSTGFYQAGFNDEDLGEGLLKVLRHEETQRGILFRYEQFNTAWGKKKYGNAKNDTTIKEGGCGPTSLAIVMQYLMNNGSLQRTASYSITPEETAKYAATHGRVSATATRGSRGTAGDPMIDGIRSQWPLFDGVRVMPDEATRLVEEGWLIIFLCKGCKGLKSDRTTTSYGGHYMVLAGVGATRGPKRLFDVLDPGRKSNASMWFITQEELYKHVTGFWWVYPVDEVEPICPMVK